MLLKTWSFNVSLTMYYLKVYFVNKFLFNRNFNLKLNPLERLPINKGDLFARTIQGNAYYLRVSFLSSSNLLYHWFIRKKSKNGKPNELFFGFVFMKYPAQWSHDPWQDILILLSHIKVISMSYIIFFMPKTFSGFS